MKRKVISLELKVQVLDCPVTGQSTVSLGKHFHAFDAIVKIIKKMKLQLESLCSGAKVSANSSSMLEIRSRKKLKTVW